MHDHRLSETRDYHYANTIVRYSSHNMQEIYLYPWLDFKYRSSH